MTKDENCGCTSGCASCFDGVTIPVGPQGPQGVPGPIGPAGADGTDGTDGADGVDGAVGPQGPQGDPGGTGATGPQGDPGDTGAPGTVGPAGAQGTQGDAGSKILFGSGAPSGGLGVDDDMYNDTTTNYPQMDVYQKVSSVWQLQGRFGNVVNPGTPTPGPQSFLFKADKISDQFLDASGLDMVVFFEDDTSTPTYFDNGEVWSSYDFTSDQDVENVIFTAEGVDLANSTGGNITVDLEIRHQRPPAAEVVKATAAIVVPLGGSIIHPILKSVAIDLLTGDKVRVVATPTSGVAGDVKITAGEFYNSTTV
jgi:hypothetical protein